MFHPVLDKIWKLVIYIVAWLFLGFIHFNALTYIFEIDNINALTDSILTVVTLGALNLGIWFYIRYNRFEDKRIINVFANIIISGIIILSAWLVTDWLLISVIQDDKQSFNKIFEKTIFFKLTFGALLYFLAVLFYYLTIYYKNYKENVKRKNELTTMLKDSELSNLKSQINPHFLFNSLNSISYLIYSDPENAHNSIVKLSEYFRYTLSKKDEQISTLNDEIENISRYLEIEKIRFTSKMQIEKEIDEKCLSYKIPVMILQPLIENAVKHGVYDSTEVVKILVKVEDKTDYFSVMIKNNFDENPKNKKGTSSGLKNVSQRLKLIYKRDDLLKITKNTNMFEVSINFPKIIKL